MCREPLSAYCSKCETSYTQSNAGTKCWCGHPLEDDRDYVERIDAELQRLDGARAPRPPVVYRPPSPPPPSARHSPPPGPPSRPSGPPPLPSGPPTASARPGRIPKIIHGTWAGGGSIAAVKTLQGITSWLEKTEGTSDYEVWIWWDDAHLYNMHVRKVLSTFPKTRAQYDLSANGDDHGVRQTVKPGRDLHNLRVLTQGMSPDEKLAVSKALIHESFSDLQPLRALAAASNGRLKLCNLRSHEMLTGMHFLNMEAYDQELTLRGMFAAAASDILRYEVLYNFGGVYMDVDIDLLTDLGDLTVDSQGALVGITPDRKGAASAADYPGRKHIACTPDYANKSLYLSNCIVAAAPHSPVIDALRQTIHLAYQLIGWRAPKATFELDPQRKLEAYWTNNITRATLDLTGPNLLRDILWMAYDNTPWQQMPAACIGRLCKSLTPAPAASASAASSPAFDRVAPVWRDDLDAHVPFWKWVAAHATFPMVHVRCDTAAAAASDCLAANLQTAPKKKGKPPEQEPFHFARFPGVPRGGQLKGMLDDLHTNQGVKTPLPDDIGQGDIFMWASVRWRVVELGKQKGLIKNRKPIILERL
ncbi:TcdA/TcdB catalytic glycosyltransferase domain-containing protein [Corallococcus carmarthensis]|uniref:TcdA/TcdB catalytic glycosyltransferase domain-containing protein n=1 Tax=Corallococcus carmarthensis TaxID=2316728 RepID=UPI0011C45A20|nr:TcdA/TcdB catalytic glycosyltransferase domain-containing protein [Corallococcus carmarthensis]